MQWIGYVFCDFCVVTTAVEISVLLANIGVHQFSRNYILDDFRAIVNYGKWKSTLLGGIVDKVDHSFSVLVQFRRPFLYTYLHENHKRACNMYKFYYMKSNLPLQLVPCKLVAFSLVYTLWVTFSLKWILVTARKQVNALLCSNRGPEADLHRKTEVETSQRM